MFFGCNNCFGFFGSNRCCRCRRCCRRNRCCGFNNFGGGFWF